jgi:hypothetical protein
VQKIGEYPSVLSGRLPALGKNRAPQGKQNAYKRRQKHAAPDFLILLKQWNCSETSVSEQQPLKNIKREAPET